MFIHRTQFFWSCNLRYHSIFCLMSLTQDKQKSTSSNGLEKSLKRVLMSCYFGFRESGTEDTGQNIIMLRIKLNV